MPEFDSDLPEEPASPRPSTDPGAQAAGDAPSAGSERQHRFRGSAVEANIPEPLRRLLEAGLGRLGDRPELIKQRLAELKLPREAWAAILAQLDDRKSGLYRLVAKEVRDLLENTNFAEDLVRALTTLSFEMKTEIRFIPNDKGGAKPSVKSGLKIKPSAPTGSTAATDEASVQGGSADERHPVAEPDTTARRATPEEP